MPNPETAVRHNESQNRFETDVDGELATADYRLEGDTIVFTHTHVPASARGEGIGDDLARTALDYARDTGLRVIPQCHFIDSWMKRHPQYEPLRRS